MQRDISIFGRIVLTKYLSRCIYPAGSLPISNKKIKLIDQMNFNYIWKRKAHCVIKLVKLVKDFKEGGLQAIDFDCMNGTFKINRLKNVLINEKNFWFYALLLWHSTEAVAFFHSLSSPLFSLLARLSRLIY